MAIKLTAREGPSTCPYCLDDLRGPAVRCPACRAGYHEECAVTFLRCAALGCKTMLVAAAATGRPLPRLATIAARLMGLNAPPPEDDEERVVVLLPGPRPGMPGAHAPRADAEAAALVGSLLGGTAFDGRLRLGAPTPEPLVRVSGAAAAEGMVARLAARGLCALSLPAGEFLRPLRAIEALEVEPLAVPVRYLAGGTAGVLPPPQDRLVITTQLVEERRKLEPDPAAEDGPRRTVSRTVRRVEPGALVLVRGGEHPVLLRRGGTRILGFTQPTAFARFGALVASLAQGATLHDLKGSSNPLLLTRRRGLDQVNDNLAAVLLACRALRAAWLMTSVKPA